MNQHVEACALRLPIVKALHQLQVWFHPHCSPFSSFPSFPPSLLPDSPSARPWTRMAPSSLRPCQTSFSTSSRP